MAYEVREGDILVSCDPEKLDVDRIHSFLANSYWSEGISREVVARSIENSIPFATELKVPERWMEKADPALYKNEAD